MAWTIEYADSAKDQFCKLDKQVARRILDFMDESVANWGDPRSFAEALKDARLGSFGKYRVGDYRVVAGIKDRAARIRVICIGNRWEVYR